MLSVLSEEMAWPSTIAVYQFNELSANRVKRLATNGDDKLVRDKKTIEKTDTENAGAALKSFQRDAGQRRYNGSSTGQNRPWRWQTR